MRFTAQLFFGLAVALLICGAILWLIDGSDPASHYDAKALLKESQDLLKSKQNETQDWGVAGEGRLSVITVPRAAVIPGKLVIDIDKADVDEVVKMMTDAKEYRGYFTRILGNVKRLGLANPDITSGIDELCAAMAAKEVWHEELLAKWQKRAAEMEPK